MKNRLTQSVSIFIYEKLKANCLPFFEVSGFLDIKMSQDEKSHPFCIHINDNFNNYMKITLHKESGFLLIKT